MNLIEKLGLEKCKQIVSDPLHPQMTHVSNDGRHWVNEEFSYIPEIQDQIQKMIRIADLRTAIANHDLTVSNSNQNDKQIDLSIKKDIEDHCIDIRNHISPLTGVIER